MTFSYTHNASLRRKRYMEFIQFAGVDSILTFCGGGGRAWIAFVTLITRILLNVVFFTTKLDRDFTLSSLFLALRAGWSWRLAYAPQISIILSNLVTNFSNCNFRAICKKILKRTYFWFKSERMLACT